MPTVSVNYHWSAGKLPSPVTTDVSMAGDGVWGEEGETERLVTGRGDLCNQLITVTKLTTEVGHKALTDDREVCIILT